MQRPARQSCPRYTRLCNALLALTLCCAFLPMAVVGIPVWFSGSGQQILPGLVIALLACGALFFSAWRITRRILTRLIQADKEKTAYDAALLQLSKMASLGKLAAGVAHEINNPLMLIREHAGWIHDLLEEEKRENIANYEDIQRAAVKVEQNVDRASEITHRLLGFARETAPSSERAPLNAIVEQAIGFLQTEAGYRGISIERWFGSPEPGVVTDVGQLQQVILNVIGNAMDAIGQGGRVEVGTGLENGMAVIRIRDNGPGIPQDRLQKIFDPFFTTKRPGEGTGLGLSICSSTMESLGGSISAANHPEGGALFIVTLPCDNIGKQPLIGRESGAPSGSA